jgi:hypothetical protein
MSLVGILKLSDIWLPLLGRLREGDRSSEKGMSSKACTRKK